MLRLENGVIYFTPYGEEEREVGNLVDGEVEEGYLSLGGHGFPLEKFPEIQTAWDELYPNGKPKPEPQAPVVTEEQKAIDMMKYLMQSDEFLVAVGIQPQTIAPIE